MTEEIVYDDSFKVGIESLFRDNLPTTLAQVKCLLDDNGYIGRNSPIQLYTMGHKTYEVKVRVLLVNSNWWYNWPLNGTYNLRTNQVVYNKKPILFDGWVTNVIDKGVMYISANPYALSGHTSLTSAKVAKVVEGLDQTGVIKDGRFRLSRYHPLEVKEFITNMLKFK